MERRDRLTSEVGPDGSGSKPGMEPWTHMPEKSGMDAPSLPLLAGATVGATACPKAGVATAAASVTTSTLGEAEYTFQEGNKLLMDTFGRVDRQYGRKLTIDLPNNGGRMTAAFYFINGRIVSLRATVLPANGDYNSPEMGRFVDSITFFPVLAADDSIELPAAPK